MTRLPHVDSARRFFLDPKILLDAKPGFRRARLALAAVTIGFGLAVFCTSAFAQNAAKGTADHIKAVTSAVDSASIKTNTATSKDWPTYGLDYAETRFSKLNQINTDNVKNLGLTWSYKPRIDPRRRSDAGRGRRHHVCDGIVERSARRRCTNR